MGKNEGMTALFPRLLAILALAAAASGALVSAQTEPETVRVSQFSGKQVPRFESLRYSAVHGRQGPSLDHPILWRYEKAGLPMLVVRETHGWRRVRDKDGDEVWVQARMLSDTPTVAVIRDVVLYRKPDAASDPRAALKPGVVAELKRCDGSWCHIAIERQKGWVEKSALWGVETATGGL